MTNGDAALAAGMDILDGTEDRRNGWDEINRSRDYIAGFAAGIRSIAAGGTGADNAAAALANLGGIPTTDAADPGQIAATKLVRYTNNNRIRTSNPIDPTDAATKAYADAVAGVPAAGGTFTGNVFYPNATAATSGYTVAYINNDGRLSRGASSERYKSDIDRAPSIPDVLAVPIAAYTMTDDPDHTARYGPIAEDLAAHEQTRFLVVYNNDGQPDSFDMISYLMAAVAQLKTRIQELEADRASR